MPDTPTRDAKLVHFLNEAYAKERQVEAALEAHAEATARKDYGKRLKDHLNETGGPVFAQRRQRRRHPARPAAAAAKRIGAGARGRSGWFRATDAPEIRPV